MERMYSFKLGRFEVVAEITPCIDLDLSFDDAAGSIAEDLGSGKFTAFDTRVQVKLNGAVIGTDWLGQSIYENPADFFTEHYGSKPLGFGSYFPDMVREAISQGRHWIREGASK